jgi:hypothetical protein
MNSKTISRTKTKVGDRFDKLIVISHEGLRTEPSGHRRSVVKVVCDCGEIFSVLCTRLVSKKTTACQHCSHSKNAPYQIGDIFGELTIVGFTKEKRRQAICQCSCGNQKITRPELLKINKSAHCGCLPHYNWKGSGKVSLTRYNKIRRGAEVRNIDFNVTHEYIAKLLEKQDYKCALSGMPIGFGKTNESFTASLDRIDSKKCYEADNVQWVHCDVNLMKMHLDEKYFLEMCKIINDYQQKLNSE